MQRWTHNFCKKQLGIIGSTISSGQGKPGVDQAPQMFRDIGLINALRDLGLQTTDYGDIIEKNHQVEKPSDSVIGKT
jgi:arginase family enzyme